jgi:hypothetical protein
VFGQLIAWWIGAVNQSKTAKFARLEPKVRKLATLQASLVKSGPRWLEIH